MLQGEHRAKRAASFGKRPCHDRLRVSGASSEHRAMHSMQKARPFFTTKHAHTPKSRACGGPWSHPLVGTPQCRPRKDRAGAAPTERKYVAKATEEKRALILLVQWACVYGALQYAALCFVTKRRAKAQKFRACGAEPGGDPQTPPDPKCTYFRMRDGGDLSWSRVQ